jgi:hypothetical protein
MIIIAIIIYIMFKFEKGDVTKYLIIFIISMIVAFVGSKFRGSWQQTEIQREYELIQKYLLNESPLYGYNKPKLWIHTTYDVNARQWKSFYSRNSMDLNQPYIHLTVKSIINHCADDFNICLIDDHTFSKLIPSWNTNMSLLPEPIRSNVREQCLAQLLYMYGGMIVPNSFLCTKNLKPLYDQGISQGTPFILENVNHAEMVLQSDRRLKFIPDYRFMGAKKNDPTIREYVDYLKTRNNGHFTSEHAFVGASAQWFLDRIGEGKMQFMGGELIGVKTVDKKTILLDDLMEENYLNLSQDCYGIYIPSEDVLRRPNYQWFASMDSKAILGSSMIISKYLASSIVDSYTNSIKRVDGNIIPSHNRLHSSVDL